MKNIEDIRILVVGDIMLDRYVVGEVKRISPEAPVPIINAFDEYHTPGGCGNVVRNIKEIGAKAHCLASIGNDIYGEMIKQQLFKIGAKNLLIKSSQQTTVKERIIADHRHVQMLRVDRETIQNASATNAIENFKKRCRDNYDIVIISDYAKGMITKDLIEFLKQNQSARILVDPKPQHTSLYNNTHMITPNENEWDIMKVGCNVTLNNVQYILVTKGKLGMSLMKPGQNEEWNIPAEPVEIYNVSGAGDTVVAIMAVCLSMGYNELNAAYIANKCAGYVVTQTGTSVVPKNKFIQILSEYKKNIE